MSEYDV